MSEPIFTVRTDKYQFILNETRQETDDKGKIVSSKKQSYYSLASPEQLLRAVINSSMSDCADFKEMLALLKNIDQKLPELCKEHLNIVNVKGSKDKV